MKLKKSIIKMPKIVILFLVCVACVNGKKKEKVNDVSDAMETKQFFKISLAQWSLHRAIREDGMSPFDFAKEAKTLGFEAIEYVSGLYQKEVKELGIDAVVEKLKTESETYEVKNLLIMVDGEGHLASSNLEEQNAAVENHKKWVDAAKSLGCHSIRVNAHGNGTYEEVMKQAVIGLTKLSAYAKPKGINVIVENHGGYTSNGEWLASVMTKVNMPNCGTLPDFGNFCITRGSNGCEEAYDKYKGVKELMPFAKAVSAKSYDFDQTGNETKIDYVRMLQIVKDANYSGYIGVEYEGSSLKEKAGIIATKKLLEKAAK